MHDPEEVFHLLQIAHLSHNWQDLWPLRDRALAKLRDIAKEHEEKAPQAARPFTRPVVAQRAEDK